MKVMQLSVFLENKAGEMSVPCQVLADAGINLLAVSLADTRQFGILRMIVSDPERGKAALERAGCVVNVAEVAAIDMPDRPGGLAEVIRALGEAKINIEYMYAFCSRIKGRGVLLIRFDSLDDAIHVLQSHGVKLLGAAELLEEVEGRG